mmetsp:Transcript_49455/g.122932  ORF Transcript_49455/g.122932 Transcript_49455/m.122932 type:complete len:225 (+) Transcript_49455:1358-2032(+)
MGPAHDRPSDTHAELQGIAWMSTSARIPRFFSFTSISFRWFSPPVMKPSGLMPYSRGEPLPPTGASIIQYPTGSRAVSTPSACAASSISSEMYRLQWFFIVAIANSSPCSSRSWRTKSNSLGAAIWSNIQWGLRSSGLPGFRTAGLISMSSHPPSETPYQRGASPAASTAAFTAPRTPPTAEAPDGCRPKKSSAARAGRRRRSFHGAAEGGGGGSAAGSPPASV